MSNRLYYGDNLEVLRGRDADGRPLIADESVDLIYLDPPFNSAANYNVLFKAPDGRATEGQIEAFQDSWHWTDSAARAYHEVVTGRNLAASALLEGMYRALGANDMMAYLAMMAVRLIELHRVLKPSGSLYLHCDPTASHYLKTLMDGVFGVAQFRNEIIWKRGHAHNSAKRFGPSHDVILFYGRSDATKWVGSYHGYDEAYLAKHYRHRDANGQRYKHENPTGAGTRKGATGQPWRGIDPTLKGRHWARTPGELEAMDARGEIHWPSKPGAWPYIKRYLDETAGVPLQDVWTDIDVINMQAKERLGYPTQKPVALLERIIAVSSTPGDLVLDPFCGCGTTTHAAEKLGRRWIGIDITHLAVSLIERRLKDHFPDRVEQGRMVRGVDFTVHGVPRDLAAARDLAERDKHQFQWWAVSLVDAVPQGGSRKGADRGIDGIRWVKTGPRSEDVGRIIVSVKGGDTVSVRDVRDLAGTVEREKALGGLLITLAKPTRDMLRDAASHGFTSYGLGDFRKIMIKTIDELIRGIVVEQEILPPLGRQEGFRRGAREAGTPGRSQSDLAF